MSASPLFSSRPSKDALDERLQQLMKAVGALPESKFHDASDDVIVAELVATSPLAVPRIVGDGNKQSSSTRASEEQDQVLFTFEVRYEGQSQFFGWIPSVTSGGARPQAVVMADHLRLAFSVVNGRDPDQLVEAAQFRFRLELAEIERYLEWLRNDIRENEATVRNILSALVRDRRTFFLRSGEINQGLAND